MAQRPTPLRTRQRIAPLCSVSQIAIAVVLGAAGGIGKSTAANTFASFLQAHGAGPKMVRVETGVRRREFPRGDIIIDLDGAAEAALGVGGEAAIFEDAWPAVEEAIARRGKVVIDAGANAHRPILEMAAVTGLADRIRATGRKSIVIVVTTPEAEAARQAATLVQDAAARMPAATLMVAVNYLTPAERPGVDTPQARAFAAQLQPCAGLPRLVLPFARAQALAAFAGGRRSPLEILRASEAELLALTGLPKVATLSAQAHFGAWWNEVVEQLERYFPTDARDL